MRKKKCIILAVLFLMFLSAGCGKENIAMEKTGESSTTLRRNTNTVMRQVGPEGNVAVSDRGMFFAEKMEDGVLFDGHRLMYYDIDTKETVAVCSNASCRHDGLTCEAVYVREEAEEDGQADLRIRLSPLGVYEDKLYVLESVLEGSLLRLYRSDPSGHNRELLWEEPYPYSDMEGKNRMILADSVIWNEGRVYVGYYAEDHILREAKELDEETGLLMDVLVDCVANMENGILCIDVAGKTGPVKVCEEASECIIFEEETGGLDFQEIEKGYVIMMAAKEGVVYYRHLHTDDTADWNAYGEDSASYKEKWFSSFSAQIIKAEVKNGQVTEEEILNLGQGAIFKSAWYGDRIYYNTQDNIMEYDLKTGQSRQITALDGAVLEDVIDGWVIRRNYNEQIMLFSNPQTGETITKEAPLGCNLYGSVVLDGQTYWFLRSTEKTQEGERIYQWYLTDPESWLTQENPERIIVEERSYH